MDGIMLCGKSAEMILEREVLGLGYGLEPTSFQTLPNAISTKGMSESGWSIQIDGIPFNHLQLLIGKHNDYRRCLNIKFHQWNGPVPPGSILKIAEPYTNAFYVASGAFLALMASRTHSLIALMQYVMYLCGWYCIHQREPLKKRGPLTSKEDIEKMLRHAKGKKGWRRLERILPYCAEGVRSPQEANYYIVATLPHRLGGYELKKPKVNACIPLNNKHAELAGAPEIEVDFYWEDAKVVVEYNGFDTHEGGITALDITQQVILQEMGIEVLFVTKAQLYSVELLDMMMQQLATRLGICPADGWPNLENVKNLLVSLQSGDMQNRRFASSGILSEQKRWIRRSS